MQRRNLIYVIVLAVLCVAIVVVVVLILRRQASFPVVVPISSGRPAVVAAPSGTIPLKDTPYAKPWKEGDPIPTIPEDGIVTPQ